MVFEESRKRSSVFFKSGQLVKDQRDLQDPKNSISIPRLEPLKKLLHLSVKWPKKGGRKEHHLKDEITESVDFMLF